MCPIAEAENCSFLRETPGKSQKLTDDHGDGLEFGLSMLSVVDWTRQGEDVCPLKSQHSYNSFAIFDRALLTEDV